MALKAVLSKDDLDALPEALRGFYVETNGKFVLDLNVDEHPGVAGLKTALEKERDGRGTLDKELKKLQKEIEGLDPVKARDALKRVQELEDKKLIDEGKVEELLTSRTQRMQDEHKNQLAGFNTKIDELSKSNGTLLNELAVERIDNALAAKAIEMGARKTALTDIKLRGRSIWKLEDGKPVPKDGDVTMRGKDPNKAMEMDEWLDTLRKGDGAHLFESSGGGGATNNTGARMSGKDVMLTREQAKDRGTYLQAQEAAGKSGGQVLIRE